MPTQLVQQDFLNFWMRVYLGTTDNDLIRLSAIDRAYRDVNRTMHGIGNIQTDDTYNILRIFINEIIDEVINVDYDQNAFDIWHRKKCDELKAEFIRVLNYNIRYGQAQKWINMSLKYMFAIGSDRIVGIDRNYDRFHIPIDNIIQDKLAEYGIDIIPTRWSRIDDYDIYLNYQILVRNTFPDQIPMDVEFTLFND